MSGDEPVQITVREEWTVEKIRTGDTEPYEVVTVHSDGSQTVWRREEKPCP